MGGPFLQFLIFMFFVALVITWGGSFAIAYSTFAAAVIVPAALYLFLAYVWRRSGDNNRTIKGWPWQSTVGGMLFHKWMSALLGILGATALFVGQHIGLLPQYFYFWEGYGQEVYYDNWFLLLLALAATNAAWAVTVGLLPLDEWLYEKNQAFRSRVECRIASPEREMDSKLQRIKDLAREIGSEYHYEPRWSHYTKGANILEKRVTENIQHLEEDLNHMAAIRDRCVDFVKRYHEAVKMVTKSPALAGGLDLLMSRLQAAIVSYVPKRAWIDFHEAMDIIEEELQKALQVAEQSDGSDSGTWRTGSIPVPEAHLIIGSAPDWSWPDIQNAYRNKVKEIRSIASNDEYIKWVDLAWQTLQAKQSGE